MINMGCDCQTTIKAISYVLVGVIFIMAILILVMKFLFDYIHDIDIKLKAMTPESRALSHAYFKILYEEHKKNREYDNRLDKMFKD